MTRIGWIDCILTVGGICSLVAIVCLYVAIAEPKTIAETQKAADIAECKRLGFPIPGLTIENCVEIQEMERSTKELRRDLEKLNLLVTPGFDI